VTRRDHAVTLGITRRLLLGAVSTLALAGARPSFAGNTPSPPDARVYIAWPQDGERIKGAFWCRFGLRHMGVAPAGTRAPNTGHHNLFIDVTEPLDLNRPIPNDKHHLHFGAGETETLLDLPSGPHTLQLVLGDADHLPFNPPVVSRVINIEVLPRDSDVSANSH
jgi:hypothetical protein